MNIYVGNVPYTVTEKDLEELFKKHGEVTSAKIINHLNGRSKGFGFVDMPNEDQANPAMKALDGSEFRGRQLRVNPARPLGQQRRQSTRQPQQRPPRPRQTDPPKSQTKSTDKFHNPYTFVPTPSRDNVIDQDIFAADFDPLKKGLNHATLQDNLWTGHIPIKLTATTPLVLLKSEGRDEDATDAPYSVHSRIPESSLRGMLRSAYETITNSRYSSFRNNEKLEYRMGREKLPYPKSPDALLDSSLKPANKLTKLSPADRLFGWTPPPNSSDKSSDSGYKSRLRIVCDDVEPADPLNPFQDDPLPLTILGTPKPEQGRFYVAKDDKGTPQDDGLNKEEAGYSSGKGLRGRKHFWHHKNLDKDYWDQTGDDSTREYIRANREKDSQNRSINAWIKPDTTFHASIYVQNLQQAEIGALLWLLTLPDEYHFRLGYGKPLGFGSVKIKIDNDDCLPLGTCSDWKAYYSQLEASPPATMDKAKRDECINKFKDSMVSAYSPKQENDAEDDSDIKKTLSNLSMADQLKSTLEQTSEGKAVLDETQFDKLRFVEGFLQVLKGPDTGYPIHYPRRNREPDEKGNNYEWFMDNENGRNRYEDGEKLALPDVSDDEGLPYIPCKPKPRRRN